MSKIKKGDEVIVTFGDGHTNKGAILKVLEIKHCENQQDNINKFHYECCMECPGKTSVTTDTTLRCRGNCDRGFPLKLHKISNWRSRICLK